MDQTKSFIPTFLRKPVKFSDLKRRQPKIHQIRMGLTAAGCGLIALIVVEFLLSVNFSNNLIFAMTFLLVSIALIGLYHSRVNLMKIRIGDWKSSPVFAGQQALYTLSINNSSNSNRHSLRPVAAGIDQQKEFHLKAREQKEISLRRPAPTRGFLEPLGADICSSFPLGIFKARLHSGELPECLVYPAPAGNQPLPDSTAGTNAHLKVESGSYTDMRRYAPGDPLSRISWKAFARFDELYTKEFDGAAGQPALWIRWDDVKAAGMEEKLSQLCRWVLDAHKKNCDYGLELPGKTFGPAIEETHLRECLRGLALYGEPESQS
jgi:uncharacterized protein (DUF58 family)